ncbi:hypothetical protein [Streptomyces lateritius]|uniref:hypothetical protein n=1 Tax=Streptomyces lateritius TaxID=67313 RepID=UPI001C8C6DE1|nr:hypothetical protein [Streptomyces lateritius]MBX9425449.1 hypothetical protein [Streptomyces lateritius]
MTVTPDQALAAAAHGLVVLAAEKQQADQAGGNPVTDEQLNALIEAAAVIARDIPDTQPAPTHQD